MPEPLAVAYVGGASGVLREIGAIRRQFGRRVLYDRLDIDERLDARYGRSLAALAAMDYLEAFEQWHGLTSHTWTS